MGICYNESCMKQATFKCSGCKTHTYCGVACQNKMWPTHKKECEMQRMLNEMEEKHEAEERAKPVQKPRTDRCTGCNTRFIEDEEECDQECPDCGYLTCESCSCSNSRGSCYCENSNFGDPYCDREPKYYHCSSRTGKTYRGDRHPEELLDENPDAFEKKPRACNNCGQVVRCLKKEYL